MMIEIKIVIIGGGYGFGMDMKGFYGIWKYCFELSDDNMCVYIY